MYIVLLMYIVLSTKEDKVKVLFYKYLTILSFSSLSYLISYYDSFKEPIN